MLDTKGWIELKENPALYDNFADLYKEHDLEVVFSHGNFMDLIRAEEQDELAPIITQFTDEYLGPFQFDHSGELTTSENPLVLAQIDPKWYKHCKRASRQLPEVELLRSMFRDADFDAAPASGVIEHFIAQLRAMEDLDWKGLMWFPEDIAPTVAKKKVGIFAEYVTVQGVKGEFDDANVPIKKYVLGMSLIYLSETDHDPEEGDYRDALIWSQAILSECDLFWTEVQWTYEHPVIQEVLESLKRKPMDIVHDFESFRDNIE